MSHLSRTGSGIQLPIDHHAAGQMELGSCTRCCPNNAKHHQISLSIKNNNIINILSETCIYHKYLNSAHFIRGAASLNKGLLIHLLHNSTTPGSPPLGTSAPHGIGETSRFTSQSKRFAWHQRSCLTMVYLLHQLHQNS